jgi:hypothetical protein
MSGAHLRQCAIMGNTDELKRILEEKSNPCSTDKYGLTALHYAVWNGHLECVKYLVCNNWGVDKHGVKGHALNMVSCKGFSPLHLAAQDCPPWVAKEVTELLLMGGVDENVLDKSGKRAIEYARAQNFSEVLTAFESHDKLMTAMREREEAAQLLEGSVLNDGTAEEDDSEEVRQMLEQAKAAMGPAPITKFPVETYFDDVVKNYSYGIAVKEIRDAGFEANNVQFPAPSFVMRRERYSQLPAGQRIQERYIKEMIKYGEQLPNITAYRCMEFAMEEGIAARNRREKLLKIADPTWVPVDRDQILADQKPKPRQGRKR